MSVDSVNCLTYVRHLFKIIYWNYTPPWIPHFYEVAVITGINDNMFSLKLKIQAVLVLF